MGERCNRTAEVRGSIPLGSTSDFPPVFLAPALASEMCGRVADRVVQIHGGAGYLKEYLAERFYRDCRIYRIYEGTTQIQQLVIAKNMIRDYVG